MCKGGKVSVKEEKYAFKEYKLSLKGKFCVREEKISVEYRKS